MTRITLEDYKPVFIPRNGLRTCVLVVSALRFIPYVFLMTENECLKMDIYIEFTLYETTGFA